jgi:Mn2+/Fe2+ NRAMP family transporter
VCEAFGWESGVSRKIREAPAFFSMYTAFIVIGAGFIMLPFRSLIQLMILSQTLNGILLPLILVVMLILVNDKALLGPRFVNGRVLNVVSTTVIAALTLLTVMLVVTSFR